MQPLARKPAPRIPSPRGMMAVLAGLSAAMAAGCNGVALAVIGEILCIFSIPLLLIVHRRSYGWLALIGAAALNLGLLSSSSALESWQYILLWGVPHLAGAYLAWYTVPRPPEPILPNQPCPTCGYDLTANASGICPECGQVTPIRAWEQHEQQIEAAAAGLLRISAGAAIEPPCDQAESPGPTPATSPWDRD